MLLPADTALCKPSQKQLRLGVRESHCPKYTMSQISAPSDADANRPPIDILILGAGWTSTFLFPLLEREHISFSATTTTGRDNTIAWKYEPAGDENDSASYRLLPSAKTVVITFPLKGKGHSRRLTQKYKKIHGEENNWIQLGSSGIFQDKGWNDETSPYDQSDSVNTPNSGSRAIAEDELRECARGCILNLAGLWGGSRQPQNWLPRVAKTKEQLGSKGALHLIHGQDVAKAIVALHRNFTPAARWLVTDMRIYDWWELAIEFAAIYKGVVVKMENNTGEERDVELRYEEWVWELVTEQSIKALPRTPENLGRVLSSSNFWRTLGIWPSADRPKVS
jgi:hypothetical protein